MRAPLLALVVLATFQTAASSQTLSLSVSNGEDEPAVELYIVSRDAPRWGDNLVEGVPLESSGARALQVEGNGCRRDVRAVYDSGWEAVRYDVDLCSEPRLRLTNASEAHPPRRDEVVFVTVANGASLDVSVTLTSEDGETAETATFFQPGRNAVLRLPRGACDQLHNLAIFYRSSSLATRQRERVDVCATPELRIGPPFSETVQAGERISGSEIELNNRGRSRVSEIYVLQGGDSDGHNRLIEVIAPERAGYVTVELGGRCRHDLRAVTEDGTEERHNNVDLCSSRSVLLFAAPG